MVSPKMPIFEFTMFPPLLWEVFGTKMCVSMSRFIICRNFLIKRPLKGSKSQKTDFFGHQILLSGSQPNHLTFRNWFFCHMIRQHKQLGEWKLTFWYMHNFIDLWTVKVGPKNAQNRPFLAPISLVLSSNWLIQKPFRGIYA